MSKPLTPIEFEILQTLLEDQECKGPEHPAARPECELPGSVMEQLAQDHRVRASPCWLCSTDDELVMHDRITSVGRLALRMAKLP